MEGSISEESIFESIRKMIGGGMYTYAEEGPFDFDIILHINTVLGILNQIGVGKEGFSITDGSETWDDFLGEQETANGITLNEVKSYIAIRVRLLFDTPASSTLTQHLVEEYKELEWRLMVKAEHKEVTE